MAPISISILGPFHVRRGDLNLTPEFRTRKERALLTYLAVESRRRHRREALAELLWPDRPEGYARTNLRQALFGLRRTIGGPDTDFLRISDEIIQFHGARGAWIDVEEFNRHVQATTTHSHKNLEACPACADHFRQAEALYRGEFLEDISVNDSQAFQEWVVFHREQYFRNMLTALRSLSEYYQRQNELDQAHKYAWRYVNLAPLEEAAHRLLMNILASNGERSAALEQYRTCQRILREELGVEPSAETIALYERIKTGIVLDLGAPIIELQLNNLPAQLSAFVGRQDLLARLLPCLENPECRLITLVGMGGVGKTRLALQAANERLAQFADGVWYVPLETVNGGTGLAPGIAYAIGLPLGGDKDAGAEVLRLLRPLEALLILDGFEHLLGQTDFLVEILRQAPRVKLLVTSRARLNYRAACLFELDGLAYPDEDDLVLALESPAVQLFLSHAQHSRAGFALSDANLASVLEICRRVDGLPLALELAASRLREYSTEQIAASLSHSLDILQTRLVDIPARQRSIHATLKYSWDRLGKAEREVLRKLAGLKDAFTLDQIQEIVSAPAEMLDELSSQSWLCNLAPGLYSFHSLVRMFIHRIPETGPLPPLADEQIKPEVNRFTAYDPLTNLPGWDLFWDRLNHLLARAARQQQQAGVALLWVENLKPLMDALGRSEGERLLRELAGRLVGGLRKSDTVARAGDDQFALILEGLTAPRNGQKVIEKIVLSLHEPFEIGERTIGVQAFIGLSIYPWDGDEAELLFQHAEVALQKAYTAGQEFVAYKAGMERN